MDVVVPKAEVVKFKSFLKYCHMRRGKKFKTKELVGCRHKRLFVSTWLALSVRLLLTRS